MWAAWLFLRFLSGCALGLSWVASEIWMNTVSGDESRGTVMGIYGTIFSIGTIAGPALLEVTGTRGAQPFVIGAVGLVVTLLPLALLRSVEKAPQPIAPMRSLAGAVRFAPFVMMAALVAGLVESADFTLLPLYGLQAGFPERTALCCWRCSWRAMSCCRCRSGCSPTASAGASCSGSVR